LKWAAAAVAATALAGCAIQPDSAPRDIPEDLQQREAPAAAPAGGEAQGSDRIFLLAPDGADHVLRTVLRETRGDPMELLQALVNGPNTNEFERGYRSAVPSSLVIHSVSVEGGVAQVDVDGALLELSGGDLIDAVAQIVFTASELPSVDSVLIRVDGATREWPDGSGAQHLGPLTTYDFIGYAESAQPAFPVAPTPTTAVPPPTTAAPTTSTTTTIVAPPTTTLPAPPAPATTVAATASTTTTA
jgi:hypothetical protein